MPELIREAQIAMDIQVDDPRKPEIRALLEEHLRDMALHSPPESVHALDVERLRQPGITFFTAREGDELLGCGALKELDPGHAEIKSMRTATAHLRKGVAQAILTCSPKRPTTPLPLRVTPSNPTPTSRPSPRSTCVGSSVVRCEPFGRIPCGSLQRVHDAHPLIEATRHDHNPGLWRR